MLINTKIIRIHEDIKIYVNILLCSLQKLFLLLQLFGHLAADIWWNGGGSWHKVVIKDEWSTWKLKWFDNFCKIFQYKIFWKLVQLFFIQVDGAVLMHEYEHVHSCSQKKHVFALEFWII